jgi:lipoprotein-anchoring transpeptidase ErfK/SrfK
MRKILLAAIALAAITTTVVANNSTNSSTISKAIAFGEKIKVKLQNKGDDKIEIFYQETAGSKNLSGATINQGSNITINVEAGSQVFYKVRGSKGPLLLTITTDMNGTTQVVKK